MTQTYSTQMEAAKLASSRRNGNKSPKTKASTSKSFVRASRAAPLLFLPTITTPALHAHGVGEGAAHENQRTSAFPTTRRDYECEMQKVR